MSPSGGIIDKLMEYIWSHWEDPIDVREGGEREGVMMIIIHRLLGISAE